jgi:hypothetical protein
MEGYQYSIFVIVVYTNAFHRLIYADNFCDPYYVFS